MMLSASSSSATVRVEKATSDLLINPDWTMNIDICDYVNTHPGQARDVLKAVKKRLQHKSPRVQFLALTLLEAMANNCGDYIHFQIVERNILEEMVKIVKKKTDMNVRDKTLSLLDTWQEAFGGQGGKYPQYYYAYDELRRSGVTFPRRSSAVAPIFTPPVAHPVMARVHEGYGMPSNPSRRLDEAMAAEKETLSGSTLESMQNMTELLSDMLRAMSPGDKEDEVVIDLVDRCRASQEKLRQMLTTAEDEKLLARGLELHDVMQNLLLKHDNIVSGSVLPSQAIDIASASTVSSQPTILSPPAAENCSPPHEQKKDISPKPSVSPQSPAATATYLRGFIDEEEEEDDDFAQLARRHTRPSPPQVAFTGNGASPPSIETARQIHTCAPEAPITATSNALALTDLPQPVKASTDQDIMDLLSLTLTTTSDSSQNPPSTPPPTYQNMDNLAVSPNGHANPYSSQLNFNNPEQAAFNSYIAPWAQPQMQSQTQPQQQAHNQPQYHQNSYGYPPPPWVSSSSSFNNQHPPPMSTSSFGFAAGAGAVSHTSVEGTAPLPNFSPPIVNNRTSLSTGAAAAPSSTGRQPYVPSYKLFEDLNVLPNRDTGHSTGNGTSSPSLSGIYEQSRVGGGS